MDSPLFIDSNNVLRSLYSPDLEITGLRFREAEYIAQIIAGTILSCILNRPAKVKNNLVGLIEYIEE